MRSEEPIMTSRRTFLANAFGITQVSARNWPIRADQVRSKHGIKQQYLQLQAHNSNYTPEVRRISGAQHT
jgi:hypothetical protein